MKVLFIIHDNHQNDNQLPLGPAYLASVLRNIDVKVDIYSMDVYHYSNEQLGNYLRKNKYDIICLGFMAARFNETIIGLSKVINKNKGDGWFVIGGHGPSPIPQYMLNKIHPDAIAIGESERTIVEIVNDKENNNNKVIYRSEPIKNLDDIPKPAWDLFPIDEYSKSMNFGDMKKEDRFLNVDSSRGCVNRCAFCYRLEKGVRMRSVPNVVDDIQYLSNKYKITHFLFADELFVLSKKRVGQFYNELQDREMSIKYIANSRVNIIDEELLSLLKESGCIFINYGFESMEQSVLDAMQKNTTVEENENVATLTKKYNIPFGLNIIWNNVNDSLESLKKGKEFIMRHNLYGQLRTIRPVMPYPGCDLYYYAINNGLLSGPEEFYNKFKNSDLIHTNFTDLNEDTMYKALFKTNRELIYDHYKKVNGDMKEADYLIEQFRKLYFEGFYKFRGLRHYEGED